MRHVIWEVEGLLCVFPAFLFLQFKEFQAQGQLQDGAGQGQQLLCQAGRVDQGNLQELDQQDYDDDLGQGLFLATGNVRCGRFLRVESLLTGRLLPGQSVPMKSETVCTETVYCRGLIY